jgi:hypothetical protein
MRCGGIEMFVTITPCGTVEEELDRARSTIIGIGVHKILHIVLGLVSFMSDPPTCSWVTAGPVTQPMSRFSYIQKV